VNVKFRKRKREITVSQEDVGRLDYDFNYLDVAVSSERIE